jgi:hypothetical protein
LEGCSAYARGRDGTQGPNGFRRTNPDLG